VETLTVRLLPYAAADGPHNMAADEALLESAVRGVASLRFYNWTEPTLSLGYFQSAALREQNPLVASLPFVRRPTGGDAIVHHFELTYALTLPPGPIWQGGEPWLVRMHRYISAALARLGVPAMQQVGQAGAADTLLCFAHPTAGDVMLGGAKVVGSAQRRRRGALLQHGSILLGRSPFAPSLAGLEDLIGRTLAANELMETVGAELSRELYWRLARAEWTSPETSIVDSLVQTRYSQDSWNRKR
jgi:lipoate-protein ligase A